ncbi:MAG: nuclear transport factor 2 family protein [Bdellovibrionales bacterium]|nr:nuclear transport factor 2 family protein [Bdellovibrionales bacterium]
MDHSTTEREILGLERKYWDAMKKGDVETAIALTRFPCLVMGPQGIQGVNESEYRKMMESHDPKQFAGMEIADPRVSIYGGNTAVIGYSVQSNGMKLFDSSTWVNEDGKWQCAFHVEVPEQRKSPATKH